MNFVLFKVPLCLFLHFSWGLDDLYNKRSGLPVCELFGLDNCIRVQCDNHSWQKKELYSQNTRAGLLFGTKEGSAVFSVQTGVKFWTQVCANSNWWKD